MAAVWKTFESFVDVSFPCVLKDGFRSQFNDTTILFSSAFGSTLWAEITLFLVDLDISISPVFNPGQYLDGATRLLQGVLLQSTSIWHGSFKVKASRKVSRLMAFNFLYV